MHKYWKICLQCLMYTTLTMSLVIVFSNAIIHKISGVVSTHSLYVFDIMVSVSITVQFNELIFILFVALSVSSMTSSSSSLLILLLSSLFCNNDFSFLVWIWTSWVLSNNTSSIFSFWIEKTILVSKYSFLFESIVIGTVLSLKFHHLHLHYDRYYHQPYYHSHYYCRYRYHHHRH